MVELPEHAIAEIKAAKGEQKATLKRYWQAWADAGDARAAEREARHNIAAAELAYRECRLTAGRPLPPGECGCGDHATALAEAKADRNDTEVALEAAIVRQKEGG